MKNKINVEAEGSELILRNKAGDHVIIPKKYRREVQDMIAEGCHNCLDDLISTLPTMDDYAQDGSIIPMYNKDGRVNSLNKEPLEPLGDKMWTNPDTGVLYNEDIEGAAQRQANDDYRNWVDYLGKSGERPEGFYDRYPTEEHWKDYYMKYHNISPDEQLNWERNAQLFAFGGDISKDGVEQPIGDNVVWNDDIGQFVDLDIAGSLEREAADRKANVANFFRSIGETPKSFKSRYGSYQNWKDQNVPLDLLRAKAKPMAYGGEIIAEDGVVLPNEPETNPPGSDPKAEAYRQDYITIVNHPSYVKRLQKEMFGDATLDEAQSKQLNDEYEFRKNKINNVSIEIADLTNLGIAGSYTPYDNKVASNESAMFHELSHATEDGDVWRPSMPRRNFMNLRDANISKPIIDPELEHKVWEREKIYDSKIQEVFDDTSREFDEFEQRRIRNRSPFLAIPQTPELGLTVDPESLDMYNKAKHLKYYEPEEGWDYYSEPSEVKARINNLRAKAWKNHGYDYNDEFDINKYPMLKEEKNYKDLRYYLNMEDDNINELAKSVALNKLKGDSKQQNA